MKDVKVGWRLEVWKSAVDLIGKLILADFVTLILPIFVKRVVYPFTALVVGGSILILLGAIYLALIYYGARKAKEEDSR